VGSEGHREEESSESKIMQIALAISQLSGYSRSAMKLILSSKSLEMFPGIHQTVWFLDLQEGKSITDICNGTEAYCRSQMEDWAKRIGIAI